MNIDSIHIRVFRALYDVWVEPANLTVLAGPNNAGKTTVANALDFLREAHLYGLEFAVSRKGGYENIAFRRARRTKQPIAFDIRTSFRYKDIVPLNRAFNNTRRRMTVGAFEKRYGERPTEWNPELYLRHHFELRASGESIEADFYIAEETLSLGLGSYEGAGSQELTGFSRQRETAMTVSHPPEWVAEDDLYRAIVAPFHQEDFTEYLFGSLQPTTLFTTELNLNNVVRAFERGVSGIQLFQLAPSAGRLPGSPTPNAVLTQRGENLPALVAYMQREDPPAWQRTIDAMRRIIPGLVDIRTEFSTDRRLALQFIERVGRPWNAEEMSDGTIQALSLFLVLHDRRLPFVIIEEPENSLHPWIVRAIVDTSREAVDKQILLTTHSPALLSYLNPDEVAVVWRENGESHVAPLSTLDPDARVLWQEGRANVFEILDGGFVKQSIPPGGE